MHLLLAILVTLSMNMTFAQDQVEATPFTNIKFGWMLGKGDYIEVQNPDFFDEDKRHFLIEVEGKGYEDIIKETKAIYGSNYKCMIAEHFTEAMNAIGVNVTDKVDLKLYLFSWGHKLFDIEDVPSTEDNIYEVQYNSTYCE
ncbi:hypothetical protein [Halobacteriovorax sp.]|mgnify:CR=1 FL=1|uniref:hypothetical protein n=1 Tax=Halobacteriovorax sp. TaxID=2020862 RepID=UPI00356B03C0